MKLTRDNYFSDTGHLSVSQIKAFMECPSAWRAEFIEKRYKREPSEAMVLGSFFHSLNEGAGDRFIAMHDECRLKRKDDLKKPFKEAESAFNYALRDSGFAKYLHGKKEVIYTGQIADMPIKCMIDVLNVEDGFFTDLKYVRDVDGETYDLRSGSYVPWYIASYYVMQMAVYQEILRQNGLGILTPYIAAVDKKCISGRKILEFEDGLEEEVERFTLQVEKIKNINHVGLSECGKCAWCRMNYKTLFPEKAEYIHI